MIAAENFRTAMAEDNWQVNGQEYLPYTVIRQDISSQTSEELVAKTYQKIMSQQKALFTKRFNKSQVLNPHFSGKQIAKLLQDWASDNGVYGADVADEISRIGLFDDKGRAHTYQTSGIKIPHQNISYATAANHFQKFEKNLAQAAIDITSGIDKYINNVIIMLADNEDVFLAEALMDAYYTTRTVPDWLKNKIPSKAQVSNKDIEHKQQKAISTVKTIAADLQKIADLGNGVVSNNSTPEETFQNAMQAIAANFNSFGGWAQEVAVLYALCLTIGVGDAEINKVNRSLQKSFAADGHTMQAAIMAGEEGIKELQGKDGKPDVFVSYQYGNFKLQLGGTIKLRQGKGFIRTSGINSQAKGVSGFVAVGQNYASIMPKVEKYIPNATEWGYGAVAALAASPDMQSWNTIKNLMGAVTLVDSIAGSGKKLTNGLDDFAGILIVNNKIFSVYDILERIAEQSVQIFTAGAKKPYLVDGFDIRSIRQKVSIESLKNTTKDTDILTIARKRNITAREILANTKISITLNLGHLYDFNSF